MTSSLKDFYLFTDSDTFDSLCGLGLCSSINVYDVSEAVKQGLEYRQIRKYESVRRYYISDRQAFVRSSIRQGSLTCVLPRPPVSPESTAVSTDNSTRSNKKTAGQWGLVGKAGGGWRSIFEINMQGANSGTAQLEYKG